MSNRIRTAHGGRRRASRRLSAAALAATVAVVLAGCTVANSTDNGGNGGGDAAAGGAGCGSEATQAAITAAADGRTIKIGYTPPILSEFYTQVEKAAHNRMRQLQECYGVNWEWSRQGALNDAHSGVEAVRHRRELHLQRVRRGVRLLGCPARDHAGDLRDGFRRPVSTSTSSTRPRSSTIPRRPTTRPAACTRSPTSATTTGGSPAMSPVKYIADLLEGEGTDRPDPGSVGIRLDQASSAGVRSGYRRVPGSERRGLGRRRLCA